MIVSALICICIILACAFIITLIKVLLMKKAAIEIFEEMEEKLKNDTNTLITVSTSDNIHAAGRINSPAAFKERGRLLCKRL